MDEKFFLLGPKWVKSSIVWERETVNHTWNIGWNPAHARGAVLAKVFPLESNCMVKVSGATGELETYNLKCLLPPNAYLQYIFLILWFWYAMLLLVNFINLLIVVMMMANSAWVRSIYLTRAIGSRKLIRDLNDENGKLSKNITKMDFGQFLFLYFVARNTSYFVSETIMWDVKKADFGYTTKTPRSSRDEESFMRTADSMELPPYSQNKSNGHNKSRNTEQPKDLGSDNPVLEKPSAPSDPDLATSSSSLKMRRIASPSTSSHRSSASIPAKGQLLPAYKHKQ